MSLKNVFVTTATLAGIVCFAGQDPRIDYSFAAPKLDETVEAVPQAQVATEAKIYTQARSKSKLPPVSVSFKNAPFSEVMAWLQKQKVSFVVDEDTVKGRRVSLNIVNQSLDTVMDAIASSLGGHWVQRGDIHVFRTGPQPLLRMMPQLENRTYTAPNILRMNPVIPGDDMSKMAEQIQAEVEKALKDHKLNDEAFWDKFGTELEKSLEKQLQGKSFWKDRAGKAYEMPLRVDRTVKVNSVDIGAFRASLTPQQKELHKKQGHLKVSDLTPQQREKLGIKDGGSISIEFTRDDDTLRIKSE